MLKDDLIKIQNDLKCPKDQYNSFGKFSYRSCEQILEAVKPLLQFHNVLLSLSDDVVAVNSDTYIKSTATVSKGDESISVTAFAREAKDKKGMDASQMTGTASSYARKYALNGLFLIDDTKDADTDEFRRQSESTRESAAKSGAQQKPAAEHRSSGVTAQQLEVIKAMPPEDVKQAAESLGMDTLKGISFEAAVKVIRTAKIIGEQRRK